MNAIPYSDSFVQNKKLGWKEDKNLGYRFKTYKDIYQDLLPQLFEKRKSFSVVVAGPSNEEVEIIKNLLEKHKNVNVNIFEPVKDRSEELREMLGYLGERVNVIEDYIFNIEKYLPKKSIDAAIFFNVVNWIPMNIIKLLEGLNKTLLSDGIAIVSFYTKLRADRKDKNYIIETPKWFIRSVERNSIKSLNELNLSNLYYTDGNGALKVYVLGKSGLEEILKNVKEKYKEARKILDFIDSTNKYKLN
ncbi:MAG: hypothetical protein QXT34_00725 [Candidatus Aenigmatarchaeota archaeon]